MKDTQVARLLAYVTGMVNRELLLQNECLIAAELHRRVLTPTPGRFFLEIPRFARPRNLFAD